MIAIIDYDAGNLKSVEKALRGLDADCIATRDPQQILSADGLILPGVGAFGDAMERLREYELVPVIKEAADRQIPLLGICLGMQLLFDESEEAPGEEGLGLLHGRICRFPSDMRPEGADGDETQVRPLKVPHMGWNSLNLQKEGRLLKGLPPHPYVYFVHSYYLQAEDESVVSATADYGITFHASVESGALYGCQFHPEKSSRIGRRILKNYMEVCDVH